MKKKLFAILLCLVMILSSVSILSEVSFAEEVKPFTLMKGEEKVGDYDKFYDAVGAMDINDKSTFYTIYVNEDTVIPADQRGGYYRTNNKFRLTSGQGGPFTLKREGTWGVLGIQTDSELTVDNITLDGNGTTQCFFISNNGKVTLGSGSTIQNFVDTQNEEGPAIYMTGGTLIIEDGTTIQNNTGKKVGGVIGDNSDNTTININGGTFSGNSCQKWGGVIGSYGTVNIFGGTFKDNSSREGGVIASYGKLNITGGTFENNKATSNGGVIRLGQKATATIKGASFNKNEARSGGAIYNSNELTINDGVVFSENKSNDYGGAIINYGKLTINAGTFKDNSAKNGGAISSTSDYGELTITGGTFENNQSTVTWGGAIVAKNKVSVKNATFDGNVSGNGGAIFAYDADNAVIESCTFKNNSATNENTVKHGGALFVSGAKDASIKNNIFNNNTAQDGGALFVSDVEGNIEGNTFEENFAERFSSVFHLKDSAPAIKNNIYKNNGKKDDKTTVYATLMVESVMSGKELTIENDKFENNAASDSGGVIVVQNGTVNLKGCEFRSNKVPEYGGAIYITDDGKLKIEGSKFIGNSAKRGGAIVTELFSQANPAEKTKYTNLKIADDVEFSGNFASDGYFNPPTNYKDFPDLKFKTTSLMGKLRAIKSDMKTYEKVDSVLNNYDVYYINPLITVTYDSNGGKPEEKIFGEELKSKNNVIKPAEHKVKSLEETGLKKDGFTFKEWNTRADGKGTPYKAGSILSTSSNVILHAIWNEDKPAPKPTEPSTVILTLDENHRGGEITNIEVEEGELIEPHLYIPRRRGYIFRGWSYDQKHLDEVKPGDRIYTNTTLYAIWKRAEEEREEEPIEIKGEDHKAYIFGYPNGTVRPNGSITRAEAAAMLARLLNIEAIGSAAKPQFTDTESSWYNKAINAVVFRGIMKGYPDGRFRPNAPITRAEFTQMISTIDNKPYGVAPFADVPGHWAERAIGSEYQAKRITGYPDGLFRPDANITRAEAAVILNKIFERKYDNLSLLKCKNPQMIKRFTDLDESFWGWNDMVEATNSHEYVRRYKEDVLKRLEEDWLLIK